MAIDYQQISCNSNQIAMRLIASLVGTHEHNTQRNLMTGVGTSTHYHGITITLFEYTQYITSGF